MYGILITSDCGWKVLAAAADWWSSLAADERHSGEGLSTFVAVFVHFNRFFVRINPEEGTKCSAKQGTSRKTGSVVKRKVANISSRIPTFLQRLAEFEWRTSN
ncbi:hypothetical protein SKAU_G00288570 [Synaphobranchus kaupii]|uniref:Uncharacterized protein n=1 Tax=Synaphobranchus kaupii TaxID=118154 RepID=A0A9Q1ET83_SYNKA|nr:hypothetical protein SKAU_G00288570 [Synaphobranchus kaupii]